MTANQRLATTVRPYFEADIRSFAAFPTSLGETRLPYQTMLNGVEAWVRPRRPRKLLAFGSETSHHPLVVRDVQLPSGNRGACQKGSTNLVAPGFGAVGQCQANQPCRRSRRSRRPGRRSRAMHRHGGAACDATFAGRLRSRWHPPGGSGC